MGLFSFLHTTDINEGVKEFQNTQNAVLLDVRTTEEYSEGHIDGSINIPVDGLRERTHEIDKSKPVYVICRSGLRSYIATRILIGNGFDTYNFAGGYLLYEAIHNDRALNIESTPCSMKK